MDEIPFLRHKIQYFILQNITFEYWLPYWLLLKLTLPNIYTLYPETCRNSYPLHIRRSHPGKAISKTSKLQGLHTSQRPLDSPLEIQASVPVIYSQPQRSRQLSATPNHHQLPVSTTRQQHKISISFQPLHQPASSKASSQPAVNSTSLVHPHHGIQVCCLDIL